MNAAGSRPRVSAADREAILEAARRLLDRVGVEAPAPVGLLALARDMGITGVQYIPDGPDGVLVRRESGYIIGVNAQDVPNRQRFTIAHEIAHQLVNQTLLPDSPGIEARRTSFFKGQSSNDEMEHRVERLCDIAAAELLLPERLLQKDDFVASGPSLVALRKVSQSYQVSPQAAGIRLIEGGWWNAVLTHWIRQVEPETGKSRILAQWSAASKDLNWLVPNNRSLPNDSVLQKALMRKAASKVWRDIERWGRGRLRGWYRAEAQYRVGGTKVLDSLLTPAEYRPRPLLDFPRKGGSR